MNIVKRIAIVFGLIAALVPVAAFAAPSAHVAAAPSERPAAQISGCKLAPSNLTCTGQDPQAMGCDTDAYNLGSAEATGQVRVAVRYSPSCQSAWARGINLTTLSGSYVTAQILRSDGLGYASTAFYPTTTVLSKMVYIGDGKTVKGIGTLQNSSGAIIVQVQTGFVKP